MQKNGPFRNTLLQHLPDDVIERLRLQRVELPIRHVLERSGHAIDCLIFLEEGIASMTTAFEDGVQIETSMFGFESVIGVPALMGARHSLNNIFMQLSGSGYSCKIPAAAAEFQKGGIFQRLALRYVQAQLTLSIQNAACNATHSYEQRLARWLLICSDRAHRDSIEMAQDFLSEMLGSTRSTISIAASRLKAKGLIDYRRGAILLLDKRGLEAEACECYRVVRDYLKSPAAFDTGFTT